LQKPKFYSENEEDTQKTPLEALDFSGYTLDRLSSILQFEFSRNDEIQKIAQEVSHYYLISVTIFD
jgi:peptidyl-dipeptidase Dcp